MKGNNLNEFMDDLYYNGGPEKELIYQDKYYLIQCENSANKDDHILRVDEHILLEGEVGEHLRAILFHGRSLAESVKQFEQAKIFNGKNIYEAEKDIEVIFG